MSTTKKAIIAAVGFIVAIAFCLLVFSLYKKGEGSINDAVSQYDNVMSDYSDVKLAMFDSNTVSGSQIVDLINDMDSTVSYSVVVKNGVNQKASTGTTSVTYKYGDTSFDTNKKHMVDETQDDYFINPNASFSSVVTRDSNGTVTTITVTQQGVK